MSASPAALPGRPRRGPPRPLDLLRRRGQHRGRERPRGPGPRPAGRRPRRPRAPGLPLGAGLRGRGARAPARPGPRGAGRGGSQDPQPGRGTRPARIAPRGGPGADRRPPVPRRPRPGPAAGHAGRARAPPVLSGGRHRRPHRRHPRGPGAGRPARSWPTCSACCPRWAWTRRTCPAPALDHLAQGCYRAGARVEVNEKWACPSPATIRALAAAGVPLVASTDSHDCADYRRATSGSGTSSRRAPRPPRCP